MNDVELKALELKRKAWEVLDGKVEADALFQELYRLERQTPEFFENVAKQLEDDNGRWSATSALPNAEIKRDGITRRIEEISFHAIDAIEIRHPNAEKIEQQQHSDKAEFKHVGVSKSAEDELNRKIFNPPEPLSVIVWRSDFGDRAWLEDFAKDVHENKKGDA